MEIVRFGVGRRQPNGPPGTTGVQGQVICSDDGGTISELAFARRASIRAHTNPNTTWFVVIEGGGWVAVDDEQARVAAGEAVLWPPGILHAAWTTHSEMRALVVEFAARTDASPLELADRVQRTLGLGPGGAQPGPIGRSEGTLRAPSRQPADPDPAQGEPS